MIGLLHDMQRRQASEAFHDRLEQAHFGETVARALQEQHRDPDVGKVRGPRDRRLARRVQRETQKGKSANAGQRRDRLRLRGHAAAERFAARDQRQSGTASRGFRDGGPHRRMRDRRRIGPLAALLHVRELVAQGRDAAVAQAGCNRLHEWMGHPGAGAVGKHETGARILRPQQQRGDGGCVLDVQLQALCGHEIEA